MAHHHRRRRSWPRTFLLVFFVVAALVGVYHCLIRKPALAADMPAGSAAVSASSSASSSQEVLNSADARKPDFYTILVSGVDDGNGGSDTNILVAFDASGSAIHCVSIPRDSGMYVRGKEAKVNSAYNRGGTELLAQSVSEALGIPVDFTIEVNLKGFSALVDAIGGVDFEVPINMDYDDPYQDLHIHFDKGMQHLDGQEALEVVRFRHNNDGSGYGTEDLGRIGTQQAFLKAVAKQTLTLSNVDKISEFSRIFQQYVDTDLTLGNLAWLGKEAISIGMDGLSFSTLPGEWSSPFYRLDGDAVLALVNESLNPYEQARTAEDLNLAP
jgi:LCP family protein required for cell wall assembly